MLLVRVMESENCSDDVPDEEEWHVAGQDDFTACGLAWTYGGTDRESETKRGRLNDATCAHCVNIVRFYKALR